MIFATLGPSSLKPEIIRNLDADLFRINMSHTGADELKDYIDLIRKYSDIPICIDTEGAQIRTTEMAATEYKTGDRLIISFDHIYGGKDRIAFMPNGIAEKFRIGDRIHIDFDAVCIEIMTGYDNCWLAKVVTGGRVGSCKATNLERDIELPFLTTKDKVAILIAKSLDVQHYALSFAKNGKDVRTMRELVGEHSTIYAKIESKQGLENLEEICTETDALIIDRGDLSREVPIEKIPFLQRRIISMARSKGVPVHVATNLLESMVTANYPTRAEANDVISTLLMGASGLVLAGETAIGKYPLECVRMIRTMIDLYGRWTENTSISEILEV